MNLREQIEAAARNALALATPAKPHPRLKNLRLGGRAQSTKAHARYRSVMLGRGWMTQRQIEGALGNNANTSTAYLKQLREAGDIERRNKDGAETYARRAGYEWRWVK